MNEAGGTGGGRNRFAPQVLEGWEGTAGKPLVSVRCPPRSAAGCAELGPRRLELRSRSATYRGEVPLPARVAAPPHCCRGKLGGSRRQPPPRRCLLSPWRRFCYSLSGIASAVHSAQLLGPETELASCAWWFGDNWWDVIGEECFIADKSNCWKYRESKLEWIKASSYSGRGESPLILNHLAAAFSLPEYQRRNIDTHSIVLFSYYINHSCHLAIYTGI